MTEKRQTIFAVDDNNTNLVACKKILQPFYEVFPASSAEKMFNLLEHVTPDLILLDVEMPDMNGYDAARKLKSNEAFGKIPLLFLSARDDPASKKTGMDLGAIGYINKPFVSSDLLAQIARHFAAQENENKSDNENKSQEFL